MWQAFLFHPSFGVAGLISSYQFLRYYGNMTYSRIGCILDDFLGEEGHREFPWENILEIKGADSQGLLFFHVSSMWPISFISLASSPPRPSFVSRRLGDLVDFIDFIDFIVLFTKLAITSVRERSCRARRLRGSCTSGTRAASGSARSLESSQAIYCGSIRASTA